MHRTRCGARTLRPNSAAGATEHRRVRQARPRRAAGGARRVLPRGRDRSRSMRQETGTRGNRRKHAVDSGLVCAKGVPTRRAMTDTELEKLWKLSLREFEFKLSPEGCSHQAGTAAVTLLRDRRRQRRCCRAALPPGQLAPGGMATGRAGGGGGGGGGQREGGGFLHFLLCPAWSGRSPFASMLGVAPRASFRG